MSQADPEWSRCSSQFVEVVESLAQLDDNSIFDALLAEKLLTPTQYEDILRERKTSSLRDIIRQVLARLMQKPSPSFSQFCKALKKIVNGDTVLRILEKSNSETTSSAATENDHDQPVASNAKRDEPSSKRQALATPLVTHSQSYSATDDQGTDSEVNSETTSSAATENDHDQPVASNAKRVEPSSKRQALATPLVTHSKSYSATDDQGTDSEVRT